MGVGLHGACPVREVSGGHNVAATSLGVSTTSDFVRPKQGCDQRMLDLNRVVFRVRSAYTVKNSVEKKSFLIKDAT